MFPAFVAFVRQRTSQQECNEITRLVFIRGEGATYLATMIRVAKNKEASSGDTNLVRFLKQEEGGWINWTAPNDMPFDAELSRVHLTLPPIKGAAQK